MAATHEGNRVVAPLPHRAGLGHAHGPEEVLLVASLSFVLAYPFERARLYRTIARLLKRSATS